MKLSLSLQQDFQAPELVLKRGYISKKVVETVLRHIGTQSNCEVGTACVDHNESHKLNWNIAAKINQPMYCLSRSDLPDEMAQILDSFPIGDLVICIPVVLLEAKKQNKAPLTHFTHMLIHGTLHLMGYDHETSEADAEEMEGIEIEILAKLGFENPYLE